MLSEEEKQGCYDLLGMLRPNDLMSLCDTVTRQMVVPETVQEAAEAIVRYSTSAEQLLNRRKLKLDVLFQYLHHSNVYGISTQSSKAELVAAILKLWRHSQTPTAQKVPERQQEEKPATITYNYTAVFNQEVKNITTTISNAEKNNGQVMAKEFIQWFYPLLNSLKDHGATDWGPQHFLPDACLSFSVTNDANDVLQERFEGAEAAQDKLASILTKDKVVFNPNGTLEGYRGAISPHGLAKVAVCGTLHRLSGSNPARDIAGVFEQCFGLLRDVTDGNRWKIKFCELKIKIMGNFAQAAKITLSEDAVRSICDA